MRLRLSSKGLDERLLIESVDAKMGELQKLLEDIAIGYEDETTIEERIGKVLVKKGQTMSLAESCT